MSIVNKLKALKGNLFGGKGNTGESRPPASTVQSFDLQSSPTGILDIDPLGFSTLSYPLDNEVSFQNGHYMLFYVNVQDKTKYEYTQGDTREIQEARLKGANDNEIRYNELANARKGVLYTGDQASGANTGSTLKKKSGETSDDLGVSSLFNDTRRISDSVSLYLPPNVEDNTTAAYNDSRTGLVGFLAASGVGAGGKDRQAMATAIGDVFGSEGTEQLIKKAFGGNADNPYMEVLFDAMQLRTFTYNFQFSPRNERESLEVQKIIQLFRFHMAPELRPKVNRYLGLPSQFDIHYMFLSGAGVSSENNFYNRIATCVLQDCKINYTPTGVKSFEDGGPVQTTMQLTFKETELLTKEKIAQGF